MLLNSKSFRKFIIGVKKNINVDNKILNQDNRPTNANKVNLHWWSMQRSDGKENVGDYLSYVVYQHLLRVNDIDDSVKLSKTKHLYAIGSIIQGGMQDATIWGSGIKNGDADFYMWKKNRKLDIRLVRGPLTQNVLEKHGYNCPKIYGDPALIMPLIYSPNKEKKNDYLVILHFDSNEKVENSITMISDDYKDIIDKICESKLVISSSLHGIILAETYGVSAIMLRDNYSSNDFKYRDYYESTGRKSIPSATSVKEALSMDRPEVPDVSELRNNILNTFPKDLFEERKEY